MNAQSRYAIFSLAVAAATLYLSSDFLPAIAWGGLLAISPAIFSLATSLWHEFSETDTHI